MTATTDVDLGALRHVLAPGAERDPADYLVEDVTPAGAFAPGSAEEVAAHLRAAAEQGLAVVPMGGRTALRLGAPLERYDVAVDLTGLRRTVEYVPADLTVTVEAGRTLRTLQAELGEQGQYLPVDPPPGDDVTVGGLLATARSGAWRAHVPSARDLVLGVQVALPSGDLVRSGGRVVKNVTGYDMHRLHTGALGAFGVIVEATFKVAPLPEATRTLSASAPNLAAAAALARRAWDATPVLRALTVAPSATAGALGLAEAPHVLLELAGSARTVERATADLRALASMDEAPAEVWATLRRWHGDAEATVVRAGVQPTGVADALEAAERGGAGAWGHLASGAVLARWAGPPGEGAVAGFRREVESLGGFAVLESGAPELRDEPQTGDAALVRELRDRFDPGRTVNPGRWGATL